MIVRHSSRARASPRPRGRTRATAPPPRLAGRAQWLVRPAVDHSGYTAQSGRLVMIVGAMPSADTEADADQGRRACDPRPSRRGTCCRSGSARPFNAALMRATIRSPDSVAVPSRRFDSWTHPHVRRLRTGEFEQALVADGHPVRVSSRAVVPKLDEREQGGRDPGLDARAPRSGGPASRHRTGRRAFFAIRHTPGSPSRAVPPRRGPASSGSMRRKKRTSAA